MDQNIFIKNKWITTGVEESQQVKMNTDKYI